MATTAFISYSHSDEKALERLHKHLAMLRRDGELEAWYDHAILPGTKLDQAIKEQLESSDLFLALVSPDYLASNYCYEKEFEHARSLAEASKIRILPIILEPCDWRSSPLAEFKAIPKDGQPVSEWTNQNNAFLDIVTSIRRVLGASEAEDHSSRPSFASSGADARRPKLKRDFDAIQRSDFADASFEALRDYFRGSCGEISAMGEDLRAKFEDMSKNAFTCTVVNRAKRSGGEANITVQNLKQRSHFGGDINYIFERHAETNSSHGSIRIDADEYSLFLTADSFGQSREDRQKLSPKQAAEWLWVKFVERAGIEYE